MKNLAITFLLASTIACAQQKEENKENKPTETEVNGNTIETACNFCTISPKEFNERMQSAPGQVVDVRTAEEVVNGKLKGAINYDFNGINFETQMQQLDKSKTVYVYCAGGGRSAKAMEWMKTNGFTSVVNLDGGINAWTQDQLPVE